MINSSLKCGRGKFENKKEEPQELGVLVGTPLTCIGIVILFYSNFAKSL